MNLIAALHDRRVFGALPAYNDLTTWRAWLAFLRVTYGLELDAEDLALFRKHTGRTTPRPGGYPEAVAIVGRQSGKTRIASALASFEAAVCRDRGAHVLLIAQDVRGAQRALLTYCREVFSDAPVFADAVARETADTIELNSGVSLSVYPCRPASVRGIRSPLVVLDELAYYVSTEGRPVDLEMVRSVRPTLATTGGKLIVLSSPYGQSGQLWDLHRQHYGKDDSGTLIWVASAPSMNSTLPADYLERMEQEDPEAYRSEVLGEFRAGIASLFDPDALDACVARGVRETSPARGMNYAAHYDASGGRGDAAALAVGHSERAGLVRVDLARQWPAPHNPEAVIGEAAAILKSYGVPRVQLDRFGGDFPVAAFARHGVMAEVAPKTTSENYIGLVPVVNTRGVVLPDLPELLRELRGLERRRGTGGRDRADHRPGAHDDLAAAIAGLVAMTAGRDPSDLGISVGDFSGRIGSAPTCSWCGGVGRIGTGSIEAPRRPCPVGCPSIETTMSPDAGITV